MDNDEITGAGDGPSNPKQMKMSRQPAEHAQLSIDSDIKKIGGELPKEMLMEYSQRRRRYKSCEHKHPL